MTAMEDFAVVRTLRSAIYGHVALVRHRRSGALFAMKRMSLAHMAAQRAVTGPRVSEDGGAELRILRRLSGNLVFGGDSGAPSSDLIDASWSLHPLWDSTTGDSNHRPPPRHHHVLTLHTDFVDARSQSRCLVLDYCPYGELYDQLQHAPSRSLAVETARRLFVQIATALAFIHAQGIAHRDLSLENVLVDAQRQCRVADFGLASERGTECKGRVGKTFYMAPEVYRCGVHGDRAGDSDQERHDEEEEDAMTYDGLRADMWSLGVMLFIMVTGVPPFETPSEKDARFQVVQQTGVDALLRRWHLHDRLPSDLRCLLTRLLCVEPLERLTAQEVLAHAWLQHEEPAVDCAFERGLVAGEEPTEDQDDEGEVREQDGDQVEQLDEQEAHSHSDREQLERSFAIRPRRLRVRKRMKIVVDGDRDGLLDARLHPPVLSHDSPFSRQIKSAPPLPLASPMVWPKVGVKAAFRRLLGSPPTEPRKPQSLEVVDVEEVNRDDEPDAEADDEEDDEREPHVALDGGSAAASGRRRPRVDSCSSCSSSSSSSSSSWTMSKQPMAT